MNAVVNEVAESLDVSDEGRINEAKRRAFMEGQKRELGIV